YYRHDLARAEIPSLPRDPHGFARRTDLLDWRGIVLGAPSQAAVFFASAGTKVIHPEPARFFEVPIQRPPPAGLNYLPHAVRWGPRHSGPKRVRRPAPPRRRTSRRVWLERLEGRRLLSAVRLKDFGSG